MYLGHCWPVDAVKVETKSSVIHFVTIPVNSLSWILNYFHKKKNEIDTLNPILIFWVHLASDRRTATKLDFLKLYQRIKAHLFRIAHFILFS